MYLTSFTVLTEVTVRPHSLECEIFLLVCITKRSIDTHPSIPTVARHQYDEKYDTDTSRYRSLRNA